jgi:RNA polymerase sigma-70 factor (ECF subfamily)
MFRNAHYLITLAGHPFSAALLAGMTRRMDPAGPNSEQRELTALLRALANGEQSALQPLYVRTSAKLYGICLRLLKNPDDAQDVLQSVFVTAWQRAHSFDPAKSSPITWLAAMTRNRAIDRLRQRRGNLEELDAAADVPDGQPSAIEVIEDAEDHRRLRLCLDELEERPRAMIRAAFLDGETYPELARREGVPLSTMKSWVRRGLMKLRGCMER